LEKLWGRCGRFSTQDCCCFRPFSGSQTLPHLRIPWEISNILRPKPPRLMPSEWRGLPRNPNWQPRLETGPLTNGQGLVPQAWLPTIWPLSRPIPILTNPRGGLALLGVSTAGFRLGSSGMGAAWLLALPPWPVQLPSPLGLSFFPFT
jgi:hypothetical protein